MKGNSKVIKRNRLSTITASSFLLLSACLLTALLYPADNARRSGSGPRSLMKKLTSSLAAARQGTSGTTEFNIMEKGEYNEPREGDVRGPIIDVISVGSITKPDHQAAQLRTIGKHASVRNFFFVTELNDTDASCYSSLTNDQIADIVRFCNTTLVSATMEGEILRRRLFSPKHNAGWMCAQKRPIDGLHIALEHYKLNPLPNYLIIIDDDTYMNMEAMVETMTESYPESDCRVVAGCRLNYPKKIAFSFPIGGFGSILTRAALMRLMKPIYCNHEVGKDDFTRFACWRLDQNNVGEANYFRGGMSVADLMYKYSAVLPFTRVNEWDRTGYCFHSDHTLGYFCNFYHIGAPLEGAALSDKIRVKHSYEYLAGSPECKNTKSKCTVDSRICHYIKPERMVILYDEQHAEQHQ